MSDLGQSRAISRLYARTLTFTESNGYPYVDGATRTDGMSVMFRVLNTNTQQIERWVCPDPSVGAGDNRDTYVKITEPEWDAIASGYTEDAFSGQTTSADIPVTSNSAWTSITELDRTLVAGRSYTFEFMGSYSAVIATTGVALTLGGPAFAAGDFWASLSINTTASALVAKTITDYNAAVIGTASILGSRSFFKIQGFVKPSANGTFGLKCRSEINLSSVTLHKRAAGKLWRA